MALHAVHAVCHHKQPYDLATIQAALPVLHKYDFAVQLEECDKALSSLLPTNLSFTASEDGKNVLEWLRLSAALQLDEVRSM